MEKLTGLEKWNFGFRKLKILEPVKNQAIDPVKNQNRGTSSSSARLSSIKRFKKTLKLLIFMNHIYANYHI